MSTIKRYASRVVVASISPFVNFSSRFIRTIIISRFLTQSDYGVVVALTTVYSIFEMMGDVGLDRFVAIKVGSERAKALAAAQQIAIVRGVVIAALIFLFSPMLASAFGAGDHVHSMRWLAGLPLIRSVTNLRLRQIQQDYRNGPSAIAMSGSQIAALFSIVPALALFHDERAMIVSLYIEAILYVAISRLILPNERPFKVDPGMRRAALIYGLPLIVNGVGLVVLSQLDRFVVGHLFGLETLALYSLVTNLALTPLSPLSVVIGNLTLAFLVNWNAKGSSTSKAASFVVMWTTLAIASGYAVGVGVFLDVLVPLIYGPRYVAPPGIHSLVVILSFLRCSRLGPTTCMLAFGMTHRLAIGNLLAGLGPLIGYILGSEAQRVDAVLAGIVVGETISTLYMYRLVHGRVALATVVRHAALLTVPVAIATYLSWIGQDITDRCVVLGSCLIIGADIALGYRRHLAPFRKHSDNSSHHMT